ncbi:hypothetical protein GCM10009802_31460 [Streptomyces synnematoformans]|uniref:Acyl-CoA carboxylase subunit epsilon n=1 Tax=Streptomyces synnematoformans TaxID=415721 RepID=A0ABP5K512_9ACTN
MTVTESEDDAVRVERGNAEPEELAALAAVLVSVLAGRREHGDGGAPDAARRPRAAQWRRWERLAAYRPPHSWQ